MSKPLIICDIDGTLLHGASSELKFARYLLNNRVIGVRQVAQWWLFTLANFHHFGANVLAKNKAWLRGCHVELIKKLAHEFVVSELPGHYNENLCNLLKRQQEEGANIVLLSGTLDVLAQAIGRNLNIHDTVATQCHIVNNIYTNGPPLQHCQGPEKLVAARQIARRYRTTLSNVTAYADSILDRHLLCQVGTPVAVNADRRLTALAARNKWPMLTTS